MYAAALKGSHVLLGSECCDTNGSDNNHIKCYTATSNIKLGCSEVDMVMNIGYFNSGLDEKVIEDIRSVRKAIGLTEAFPSWKKWCRLAPIALV